MTPLAFTGTGTPMWVRPALSYCRQMAKSSAPKPGAVWTQPEPASRVTCSPLRITLSRSKRGCLALISSNSLPLRVASTVQAA